MYAMLENNCEITLWCDKKVDSTGAKCTSDANEVGPVTKPVAVEEVKKELVEKYANKFSEPQYKPWALHDGQQWTVNQ